MNAYWQLLIDLIMKIIAFFKKDSGDEDLEGSED